MGVEEKYGRTESDPVIGHCRGQLSPIYMEAYDKLHNWLGCRTVTAVLILQLMQLMHFLHFAYLPSRGRSKTGSCSSPFPAFSRRQHRFASGTASFRSEKP